MPEIHSTGRGGAGNIGPDAVTYVDGAIVREGRQGQSATNNADYSTGRGGAGNIDAHQHHSIDASTTPAVAAAAAGTTSTDLRTDEEIIPEPAMHEKHYENYHTGRGGQGNVHKDKYGGHSKPQTAEHMVAAHGQAPDQAKQQQQRKTEHHSIGDKVKALFEKKH